MFFCFVEIVTEPMYAACCKTLIGCRVCMETALALQASCPRCRHEDARALCHPVLGGLAEAIQAIDAIVQHAR